MDEDYQTSIGVILKMGASAEAASEVPGLLDFPDMLGESDKIDVTTMKDTQRKYKPGLSDPGDMAFTFGYEGMKTGTNWATLKGAKDADKTFILLFPDGSGFTWTGRVSLSMPGKGVAEALTFTAKITPSSDIEEYTSSGG